jgi:hypothetical protein
MRSRPVDNKWIGIRITDPDIDLAAVARAQGAQGPSSRRGRVEAICADAIAAVDAGAVVDARTAWLHAGDSQRSHAILSMSVPPDHWDKRSFGQSVTLIDRINKSVPPPAIEFTVDVRAAVPAEAACWRTGRRRKSENAGTCIIVRCRASTLASRTEGGKTPGRIGINYGVPITEIRQPYRLEWPDCVLRNEWVAIAIDILQ